MMDYAAIILAVGGALGGIIGVWGKHIYDSRKLAREECSLDDDRADKMSQYLIGKYETRITALETEVISIRKAWGDEVRELQKEHQDCIRKYERLLVKIEMIERKQRSE